MADDKKFAVWGVEKGKTYYIKASGFEGKTELVYHQIKVNEKSGLTRKKAVKIARNKWIKGTIAAGNSNVDWYKIKLSKNAKFKIQAKGVASGSIQVKICNKKGKVLCIETIVSGQKSYNLNSKKSYKKGTYYIVICRKNSKASGMYQIKWK